MCHNETMRKGQTHPSTALYKKMIADALIGLLYEKTIDTISITELCDKAQVSRRTFYRHFQDKNEVVEQYVMGIMENLALTLKQYTRQDKPSLVRAFFDFLQPYTRLFAVLNANQLGDIVFTCYIKCVTTLTFPPAPSPELYDSRSEDFSYGLAFLLGGLWSLLTYWIAGGCQKTPAELTDIVCQW